MTRKQIKLPHQIKKWGRTARAKEKAELNKLRSNPCTDCKRTYHPTIMEWDHVGPKTQTVTQARRRGPKQFLAELENCDLVCANCHRYRGEMRRLYMSGAGVFVDIVA